MQVVIAMMRRPPEGALLPGRLRKEREPELPEAVELERSMTEVAVVPGRDSEHPQEVRTGKPGDHARRERDDKNQQHRGVEHDKRHHRAQVIVLPLCDDNLSHYTFLEVG